MKKDLLNCKIFDKDSENYLSVIEYCRNINTPFHNNIADCIEELRRNLIDTLYEKFELEEKYDDLVRNMKIKEFGETCVKH